VERREVAIERRVREYDLGLISPELDLYFAPFYGAEGIMMYPAIGDFIC
jgi:hypothetical protein